MCISNPTHLAKHGPLRPLRNSRCHCLQTKRLEHPTTQHGIHETRTHPRNPAKNLTAQKFPIKDKRFRKRQSIRKIDLSFRNEN